ncbi:hypothetical protein [Chamaesiphon sp. OTE_75_metabat_556]|uniref:hypothetical protein n=1 Tax=Chamaesiphon sp. OTE_75_metabat_556 TaxID=2964692 RepID=UPI00286A5151|nr:hypothetical protein [Chamaesiphon sp. OTE_75_metabat_556]
MYDRHQRLWSAISLSTIVFGLMAPALAKPNPLASVVTSQPTEKTLKYHSVSATPLDAVLANIRPKALSPAKVKRGHQQANVRATQVRKPKDRSLQGISHLTDTDRNPQKVNVSAVDRLID